MTGSPLHALLSDPSLVWAVFGQQDTRRLDTEFGYIPVPLNSKASSNLSSGSGSDNDGEQVLPSSGGAHHTGISTGTSISSSTSTAASGARLAPGSAGIAGSVFGGLVIDVQSLAAVARQPRSSLAALAVDVLGCEGFTKSKSLTRSNWGGILKPPQMR